jgi:hypothetical protein
MAELVVIMEEVVVRQTQALATVEQVEEVLSVLYGPQ